MPELPDTLSGSWEFVRALPATGSTDWQRLVPKVKFRNGLELSIDYFVDRLDKLHHAGVYRYSRLQRTSHLGPHSGGGRAVVARGLQGNRSRLEAFAADGKKIIGYGASTKGNAVLQFCGIWPELVSCIAEVNEEKFGAFTPGTGLPIVSDAEARAMQPDYFSRPPLAFPRGHFVARGAIPGERWTHDLSFSRKSKLSSRGTRSLTVIGARNRKSFIPDAVRLVPDGAWTTDQ